MNSNVEKILIIGLGMIGASIALASKSKGIKVVGYDLNSDTTKEALNKQIIDSKIDSLEEINSKENIMKLDLVIIAIPPKQTLDAMNNLRELWDTDITITDTSSVKNHIKLDDVSNIVLSHPIAGSDQSGLSAANENLFTNKKNVMCNPFNAHNEHYEKVENFWSNALQMRTASMTVSEHDLVFALTSHLPHLISYALIDSIRLSNHDVEDNAGGGIK